jgi:RhtB (resistance to homoserine/threonine) family protein
MQFLNDWLTVAVVAGLVIIGPGPNLAMTLRNSLVHSRQAGVCTAAGLAVGDLVHISGWLVGLGVVISKSVLLFNLLKGLGAAYLIYMGIRSLQAKKQNRPATAKAIPVAMSPGVAFRTGFLTCLLNPKVTLFFLALFTQIIRPNTPLPVQVVYGLTVVGIEFSWFALVAVAMSQSVVKNRFLSISHWFERVMGIVLIALGLRLAIAQGSK